MEIRRLMGMLNKQIFGVLCYEMHDFVLELIVRLKTIPA